MSWRVNRILKAELARKWKKPTACSWFFRALQQK
ncbi:hypothetical protein LMED105_12707 [Limnobacter sp. MED105]|jgi:hypothetical protein|nr:hypothetical protein LMED105_12707 [Limnobacter sp. MED105]